MLLNMAQRLSAWRRCPRNRNQCSFGARHPSAGRRQIHQRFRLRKWNTTAKESVPPVYPRKCSEVCFPDPLDVFGTTTFEVASFSGNEKLADNESRKARKSEREKEDAHRKPRRRRSRSGSSGAKANPLTRAKALRIRRNLLLRKERGSVAPFAPVAQARKQAPAAGQAGSAEPAQRRSARKSNSDQVQSVPAVNLRVCAMHLRKQQGDIRLTVRIPASRAK